MRDYKLCPGREVRGLDKAGREIALCTAVVKHIGFPHMVSEGVCKRCAESGPPDPRNPYFREFCVGQLRVRLWCPERHDKDYPAEITREAAFTKLARRFLGREEAKDVLREAARRGLNPDRLAAMAETEGIA